MSKQKSCRGYTGHVGLVSRGALFAWLAAMMVTPAMTGLTRAASSAETSAEVQATSRDAKPLREWTMVECRASLNETRQRIREIPAEMKAASEALSTARAAAADATPELKATAEAITELRDTLAAKEAEFDAAVDKIPEVAAALKAQDELQQQLEATHRLHADATLQLRHLLRLRAAERKDAAGDASNE